jgi:hypothetical protein
MKRTLSGKSTIPFLILADQRTVEIASAILQQRSLLTLGTANVTALGPAIIKSHLYAEIIGWVYRSQVRRKQLIQFYLDEWSSMPVQNRDHTMPVRWDVSANNALAEIAKSFPYKHRKLGNKSLTFCVIMAFSAKYRYKIGP